MQKKNQKHKNIKTLGPKHSASTKSFFGIHILEMYEQLATITNVLNDYVLSK